MMTLKYEKWLLWLLINNFRAQPLKDDDLEGLVEENPFEGRLKDEQESQVMDFIENVLVWIGTFTFPMDFVT